jgi:hypothetical protein
MKLSKYSSVEDFVKALIELSPAVREEIFFNFCRTCYVPLNPYEETWCDEHSPEPQE